MAELVKGDVYPHHVGVGGLHPQAIIRDAPVGGVNVEHLVHRRDVEEDEERRGWGYLRGEVFGAEMPFLGHAKSALRLASETIEEIAVSRRIIPRAGVRRVPQELFTAP